jgi:hypothetical protein
MSHDAASRMDATYAPFTTTGKLMLSSHLLRTNWRAQTPRTARVAQRTTNHGQLTPATKRKTAGQTPPFHQAHKMY